MKRERIRTKDIFLREDKYLKQNKKDNRQQKNNSRIEEPVDAKVVYLVEDWKPFYAGVPYIVHEEGFDWVRLKNGGKSYHIPKSFLEKE